MITLTQLMIGITSIGNLSIMVILSIAVIGWLLLKNNQLRARFFAIVFALGMLFVHLLKLIIQRPRPIGGVIEATGFSFPSGHAAASAIFFCLIIYLYACKIKNTVFRYAFVIFNLLLIILISYSRVYLGVHWVSDVVFGSIFGVIWVLICIRYFDKKWLA